MAPFMLVWPSYSSLSAVTSFSRGPAPKRLYSVLRRATASFDTGVCVGNENEMEEYNVEAFSIYQFVQPIGVFIRLALVRILFVHKAKNVEST